MSGFPYDRDTPTETRETLFEDRDRTVHGRTMAGWEIVRYDRAGKWYLEREGEKRQHIRISAAVELAAVGEFYPRKPGGQVFDSRVRKLRAELARSA